MIIYELLADANHFENLILVTEEDYDRLIDEFNLAPMRERWLPLEVVVLHDRSHRNRPVSDFPSLDGVIPVFSERAVEALRDVLEENGELLPLAGGGGKYSAYNVLRAVDALDLEQCQVARFDSGDIMHVEEYAFHPEALKDTLLFKLTGLRKSRVFVSEAFVERTRAAGLVGFWFKPVWSHPAGCPPDEKPG